MAYESNLHMILSAQIGKQARCIHQSRLQVRLEAWHCLVQLFGRIVPSHSHPEHCHGARNAHVRLGHRIFHGRSCRPVLCVRIRGHSRGCKRHGRRSAYPHDNQPVHSHGHNRGLRSVYRSHHGRSHGHNRHGHSHETGNHLHGRHTLRRIHHGGDRQILGEGLTGGCQQ